MFVISSLLLFRLSQQNPHATPTLAFIVFTSVYGAAFSFVGGLICQIIAKTADLKINSVLALIIAGFATFSLLKTTGNHWTQILAILLFAPALIFGGLFYIRKSTKAEA